MAEKFSRHVAERVVQRRIRFEEGALVLRYGKEIHRAGPMFVFLGHWHIPERVRHDRKLTGLKGMIVIDLPTPIILPLVK